MPDPDLSSVWYVMYRTSDGAVVRTGQMPRYAIDDYPSAGIPAGHALLEVDREADLQAGEWIVAGALSSATAMTPSVSGTTIDADGVDTVSITGLPNPCQVLITHSAAQIPGNAPGTTVTDGTVQIRTVLPGTISVKIDAPGKLTWTADINAV